MGVVGAFEGIVAKQQSTRVDKPKRPLTKSFRRPNKPAGQGTAQVNNQPAPANGSVVAKPAAKAHARPARGNQQRGAAKKSAPGEARPAGQSANQSASQSAGQRGGKKPRRQNNRRGGGRFQQEPTAAHLIPKKVLKAVPPIPEKTLRIIPLGGQEEVGRNMTVFEYGNDIVIIDMGVQFPEDDMPGIDYIVPNVSYLKGKEKNIRGVIFTHGHLDHIGAAPILLKQLQYPTIVGRDFTLALVKRKVEDVQKGAAERLKTIRVKSVDERLKLGAFEIRFFEVEHSIMDSMGIALVTPNGSIVHMGDWTIANEPVNAPGEEQPTYNHLEDLPKPTFLLIESLGALKKGLPPSETEVHYNLQQLIRNAPGRIIIGTFASQVRRIAYLLEYAEAQGKKVALEGYSMKMNIEVAKELGYIKVKQDTLITTNDIHKYPDNKVVILCTGAQGESNAALTRIVTDNHRFVKLQKTDTIVFSSSVIPGNERSIQRLKDNLYRKCDNVIHSEMMEIHVGGHGTISEIEEIIRQVKATYVLPVYANHYFIKEAAKIAYRMGYPEKNVFTMDNGHILEIPEQQVGFPKLIAEKADTSYVFVDGLGIGDIGHVVLRDRQMLAQDGMVVVTVVINGKSKSVVGAVQVTSRGFVHVKENFDLINEVKKKTVKVIKDNTSKDTSLDWELVRNQMRDQIGQYLFQKTERRPMILPVVIEV